MADVLFTSLLIALGLAMDSFAVSLGVGTGQQVVDRRSKLRLAFHLGLFQGGLTFLGWLAGSTIANLIGSFDHWLAFGLLVYVGSKMIWEGSRDHSEGYAANPSKGRLMIILSVATSIDAMAVGLSMSFIDTPVLIPSIVIAMVTILLSIIGLNAGKRLGEKLGKRMEIAGGILLILIGVRILISHLFPAVFG